MRALLLAGLAAAAAWAQPAGVRISAEVDRRTAALNDQLVLSVTVAGNRTDLPEPQLPSIPNMSVYSSGRSQNISIVNGQVESAIVYTYVLVPRFAGRAVIGPIGLTVDGQRVETSPMEIQITRPSQQPGSAPSPTTPGAPRAARPPGGGGGPEVFVTASVDKPKAFVNEQVTLAIRFHTAVTLLGNPEYVPPGINGFIAEDLPPERHGKVQANGRLYHYSEIRTALFPAQSGKLPIAPAVVRAQVQAEMAVDPFAPDFFQRFFSQGLLRAQTRELRTDPLTVTAEPLPEAGKPASFTGAVGQYRITGGVDKRSLKVGEALNLTVTVEGTGNLKALGAPRIPESPSWRAYDTVGSLNLNKAEDVVRGSKVFRTVLVPRVSGTLTIPSIPFSYFDPTKREYVHAGTSPIDVEVAPAAAGSPGASYVAPSTPGADLTQVQHDIRYIKESASAARSASGTLTFLAGRTFLHLIPLALFLSSLAVGGYRERLLLDPQGARFRRAAGRAQGLLKEAGRYAASDAGRAAAKVGEALSGFIADKLGRSASGLTLRDAQDAIRARFPGVAPDRLDRLRELWQEVDQLRFAGGTAGADAAALASGVGQLLRELDREMSATRRNGAGRLAALLALAALAAAPARAQGPAEGGPFGAAAERYRGGDYAGAAKLYEAIAAERPGLAAAHYNLANARFKEGAPHALGHAVAGYLRAWELAPRDPDVRHNLEFALSRAGETLIAPGTPRALFWLFHILSRAELLGLQWIGYWACLLLGSLFLLAPASRERVKPWLFAALAFWAAFGAWWSLRTLGSPGRLAVVLEPNAEARSGPGRNFPVSFNAPEGRRVVILNDSGRGAIGAAAREQGIDLAGRGAIGAAAREQGIDLAGRGAIGAAAGEFVEVGVLKEGLKGWVRAQHLEAL
ncbi:MAG: BatD family protein [Elusimicrobia bacterium]|nr:BatD family protein [Elusimicrobiota bacterium]